MSNETTLAFSSYHRYSQNNNGHFFSFDLMNSDFTLTEWFSHQYDFKLQYTTVSLKKRI